MTQIQPRPATAPVRSAQAERAVLAQPGGAARLARLRALSARVQREDAELLALLADA